MNWMNLEDGKFLILWTYPWEQTLEINKKFWLTVFYASPNNSFWEIVWMVFWDEEWWNDISEALKIARKSSTYENWSVVAKKQLEFCKKNKIGLSDIYEDVKPKTTNKKSSLDKDRKFVEMNDFDSRKYKLIILNWVSKTYELKPITFLEFNKLKMKLYKWVVPVVNCISTSNSASISKEKKAKMWESTVVLPRM